MDKKRALEVLDQIPTIGEQVDALEMAIEALENSSPKGKWIEEGRLFNFHKCSNCGEDAFLHDVHGEYLSNYCPNCGADMRESE